jgi:hypothetical protein
MKKKYRKRQIVTDPETLHEYAMRIAKQSEQNPPSLIPIENKLKLKKAICLVCGKQCQYYTSKNDNTYLANDDRSPHRKGLDCKNNWDEYNG